MSQLFAIFVTVFLAELGDKTQLATVLFATDAKHSPWLVFAAAAAALCLSTALAVFVGANAAHVLEKIPVKLIAGAGFVAIGLWTMADHFRAV